MDDNNIDRFIREVVVCDVNYFRGLRFFEYVWLLFLFI